MQNAQIRPKYIEASMIMLLTSSFLDSIRGPVLPLVAEEFGISFSQSSMLLVVAHLSAACMTWFAIPMMKFLKDSQLVMFTGWIMVAVAVQSFFIKNYSSILLWSLSVGASMSIMGTLCNVLMVKGLTHNTLSQGLSALHAMYGLGSMLAPVLLAVLLEYGFNWRVALWFPLLGALWLMFASRGVQKIQPEIEEVKEDKENALSKFEQLRSFFKRIRTQKKMWIPPIVFSLYVVGEVLTSMWMVSYLLKVNLNQTEASNILGGFFLVLLVTRLLAVIYSRPQYESIVLFVSLVLSSIFFVFGRMGWHYGFAAAGILGPFYPLYMARVNRVFNSQDAKLVTVFVVVTVQLSLAIFHGVFGGVSDKLGVEIAYYAPPILLLLAAIGSFFPSVSK